MKKYLKRWNKLTEDEKIMFFDFYMRYGLGMCWICPQPLGNCHVCDTIFPDRVYGRCPCNLYYIGAIKESPQSVVAYCLIHDGWIEKED